MSANKDFFYITYITFISFHTRMWEAFIAGIPMMAARIHISIAMPIVILVALRPLCEWNLRRGSTIAKNRSPDNAVRVNTDTPIDKSLKNSDILQINSPQGHESTMKTADVKGTFKNMYKGFEMALWNIPHYFEQGKINTWKDLLWKV